MRREAGRRPVHDLVQDPHARTGVEPGVPGTVRAEVGPGHDVHPGLLEETPGRVPAQPRPPAVGPGKVGGLRRAQHVAGNRRRPRHRVVAHRGQVAARGREPGGESGLHPHHVQGPEVLRRHAVPGAAHAGVPDGSSAGTAGSSGPPAPPRHPGASELDHHLERLDQVARMADVGGIGTGAEVRLGDPGGDDVRSHLGVVLHGPGSDAPQAHGPGTTRHGPAPEGASPCAVRLAGVPPQPHGAAAALPSSR